MYTLKETGETLRVWQIPDNSKRITASAYASYIKMGIIMYDGQVLDINKRVFATVAT